MLVPLSWRVEALFSSSRLKLPGAIERCRVMTASICFLRLLWECSGSPLHQRLVCVCVCVSGVSEDVSLITVQLCKYARWLS